MTPRTRTPSPSSSGAPIRPEGASRALIARPTAKTVRAPTQTAAENPSSVFSTLCNQLSNKPLSKVADALPSTEDVQSGLQDLETATGLKKTASGQVGLRAGPKKTFSRSGRAGDLQHDSRLDVDLGAEADAAGQVKVGLAGAEARGGAQGEVGVGGRLEERWSHPLGEVAVDAKAQAKANAKAKGQATLDARGLKAHGEIGARAKAEAKGHAVADTVFGRAEGEARAAAEAYANADADYAAGLEGVRARVAGEIGAAALVEAKGEARSTGIELGGETIDVRADVAGRAEVAAKAEGEAKADLRFENGRPQAGVDIGGRAFAGARAEGEVSLGIGEIAKVKARGGAWVGAGAEGHARAHFDGKKLRIGLRGGAAVKAGAGGGATVEIDVEKAANAGIGAGIQGITAPIRYALDPMALPRDASQAVTMGLSLGQQLVSLPGQILQGASQALDTPIAA